MTASFHAAVRAAPSRVASPARSQVISSAAGLSRRAEVGLRTVRIATMLANGSRVAFDENVPALPLFDEAFSAFARGTRLQTPSGDIAVEDLVPGDTLRTMGGRDAPVAWIGTSTHAGPSDTRALVRIVGDSFGEGRPNGSLTLGPGARILQTPPHLRCHSVHTGLLTPAGAFIDAVSVVEITPPVPVDVFHVMLDRHAVVQADGLDCETFHPGADIAHRLDPEHRALFLSLFPAIPDMAGFGPLIHPRAPAPAS